MKTFGTCHFSLSASPSATTICYSSSLSRETTLSVAFVTINGMYLCVCVNECVWCMIQTGLLLLLTWPLPSVITFSTLKSSTCVKTVIIFTVIAFSLPPVNFLPVDVAGVWSLSADSVHRFPSELSVSCQLSVYLPESPLFTRVAAGTAAAWHVRVCVCVCDIIWIVILFANCSTDALLPHSVSLCLKLFLDIWRMVLPSLEPSAMHDGGFWPGPLSGCHAVQWGCDFLTKCLILCKDCFHIISLLQMDF